jgi:hypothetical protein
MSATPTEEEILEAVQASGYLMEQEVATYFESLKYHVRTNRAYQDPDENKSREIDVWTFRIAFDNKTHAVYVEFICECKNNTNPFVFLGRPQNESDKERNPLEYIFPVPGYYKTSDEGEGAITDYIPAFLHLGLAKRHYYYNQNRKAVQFCKILRKGNSWEANHETIFGNIIHPIVKAFLSRRAENAGHMSTLDRHAVYLLFPMVVLNSDIYYIDSTSVKPQPQKVPHVTLIRELKSKTIDGTFAIDFVTKSQLKDFIEGKIEPFIESVIDSIEQQPERFIRATKR